MFKLGSTTINKVYLFDKPLTTTFLGQSAANSEYLLDVFPGARIAYSLRQLRNDVTNVIRCSRNDGVQRDFTAEEITDGTLVTWAVGGNAFVRRYYDQSGNGVSDLSILANFYPIVQGGVLLTDNGKPYVSYSGDTSANSHTTVNPNLSGSGSMFLTYNSLDPAGGMIMSSRSNLGYIGALEDGTFFDMQRDAGTPDYYVNGNLLVSPTRDSLYQSIVTGSDELVSIMNINFVSGSWDNPSPMTWTSNTYAQALKFKEFIIYNNDQTANKTAIESNIAAYYNIT